MLFVCVDDKHKGSPRALRPADSTDSPIFFVDILYTIVDVYSDFIHVHTRRTRSSTPATLSSLISEFVTSASGVPQQQLEPPPVSARPVSSAHPQYRYFRSVSLGIFLQMALSGGNLFVK